MRLAVITDKGRRIHVYEGRKHIERFEVDVAQLTPEIVEEARTWRQAPDPKESPQP